MITVPISAPTLLFAKFTGPTGLTRELRTLVRPGFPYCVIDRRDAYHMGFLQAVMDYGPMHYELPPERLPWMATVTGLFEAPLFTLAEVSVGDLSAKNVVTMAHDLPDVTHIDAILGETFLNNFTVVFDYKKRQLRLE